MMAMLSRKATDRAESFGSAGEPPKAAGRTWLPSATNRMIAAAVAQVVIRWLLAILTARLLVPCTSGLFSLVHQVQVPNENEDNATFGTAGFARHFPIAHREQIGNMDQPSRQLRSAEGGLEWLFSIPLLCCQLPP